MFESAMAFNQPLSWDTPSVTNMGYMFYGAPKFNQPLDFDTSSVTAMDYMFEETSAFNQPLSFDTSSVTTMSGMFYVRFPRVPPASDPPQLAPSLHAACAAAAVPTPSHPCGSACRPLFPCSRFPLGRIRRRSTSR